MKSLGFATGIGLLVLASASAQEFGKFTFDIGGGFTNSVGSTSRSLDNGWNVRGGVGYNLVPWLGVKANFGYDSMGINSETLTSIGVPGGNVSVFTATVDPVVHLTPRHHMDVYLTAGGGLFHRTQQLTQPTIVIAPGYNPFFGFYSTVIGANQILASSTLNKPGFDVGGGVAFGSLAHGRFFAEARWDRMFVYQSRMDFVPVTFGFRW
jgi:hypothetical protein